jgi:hypothetical protein
MSTTPWRPSKPVAYLVVALTLWPPVYIVLFFCFIGFSVFSFAGKAHLNGEFFPFQYIFALHCLTMFLMFALTGIYLVHVFRTDQLPSDRRIMWTVVLVFFNMFAMPVYWWFYMRPGASESNAT